MSRLRAPLRPLPLAPTGVLVIYAEQGRAARRGRRCLGGDRPDFARLAAVSGFTGKAGQTLLIPAPPGLAADRLLLLGAGRPEPDKPAGATVWSDRGGSLLAKLPADAERVAVLLDGPDATPEAVAELAAGIRLRHYKFDRYKARRKDEPARDTLTVTLHVADPAAADAAIAARMAVAEGTLLARDPVNEPPNVLGTEEFAARAGALAGLGVGVEVLGEAELRALGMNAMLAVAQGSARPPRLVVLRWNGGVPGQAPLAVVGKGVVFDSGGISIKPGLGMEDMKGDMGGAPPSPASCTRWRPAWRRPMSSGSSGWSRTCRAAPPCGPATSCAPCRAPPSRSSTPTPRAGSCSPTCSGTPSRRCGRRR